MSVTDIYLWFPFSAGRTVLHLGQREQSGWQWLISERVKYAARRRLVSQLTIQHIRAKRSMKAYTTHYALSCMRGKNKTKQPFHKLVWHDGKWKILLFREFCERTCSFWSIISVVSCGWEKYSCVQIQKYLHVSCNVLILLASLCCGVGFHSIHSASWWKWRNAIGYLIIRGSQKHPFIVPVHGP